MWSTQVISYTEKPYFMLPYTVIGGIELFFSILATIAGSFILHGMNFDYHLWHFIPVMLIIMGTYFFFWIKSIMLFKHMEVEITIKREENARIESIRQSIVSSC
ncbi:hypothetical protein NQ314_005753 [Rhamnusium bicolor]|uniref:Uncharacterized protein n=1 Tax=Rhamnusium bicolor TaxID=1586634 RepID=A0AAV8ZEK7_9CUCU|nr:hypothetical protein NQ314_005753 [Rhamnusium bicolor]